MTQKPSPATRKALLTATTTRLGSPPLEGEALQAAIQAERRIPLPEGGRDLVEAVVYVCDACGKAFHDQEWFQGHSTEGTATPMPFHVGNELVWRHGSQSWVTRIVDNGEEIWITSVEHGGLRRSRNTLDIIAESCWQTREAPCPAGHQNAAAKKPELMSGAIVGLKLTTTAGETWVEGAWQVPHDTDHVALARLGASLGERILSELAKQQHGQIEKIEIVARATAELTDREGLTQDVET